MFNICLSFIHPQWGNNTQARTSMQQSYQTILKRKFNSDRDREHICSFYSIPHILLLSNPRGLGQLVNRYRTHKCVCHLLANVYTCVQGGGVHHGFFEAMLSVGQYGVYIKYHSVKKRRQGQQIHSMILAKIGIKH
jgi:hypothetical protein